MVVKKISFKNFRKQTLRGFVHLPSKKKSNRKALIYLHGFPGHCTGSAEVFAKLFEKLGYLVLRFDFSGTDLSDGTFSNKLMSCEVTEVKDAIDFLFAKYGDQFDELILSGISTGAIDASLYAHTDKRVSKLVLLGAVSDLKHAVRYDFSAVQVHDFWTKGYVKYSREGKWMHGKKIKKKFYDEFFKLDIPKAIRSWNGPTLIVHGSLDEAIPVTDPKKLFEICNKPKKLLIVRGADHVFSNPIHGLKVVKAIDKFGRKKF
ncbi:hypothetical protein CL619_03700 [archaeon]|nr:hypothetical protein [archaeon]|tara:strand:+ start:242 stop:1024 length:783 start_codon:yes stop_codon:yes gene_type:complete